MAFLSLFFSVASSRPALAACRFSCLAVNCGFALDLVMNGVKEEG